MAPIVSLLLILGISLIVTRVASVALEHTGLSRASARFQARSAFSGVGYTTTESEGIVSHPVRRKIVMTLMLLGNVGVVSAMAALLLSAIDLRSEQGIGILLGVLVAGIAGLWAFGSSRWVDRWMCRAIAWALRRWARLDAKDYEALLHLRDEFGVARFRVEPDDWIADRRIAESRLAEEGLLVLSLECPAGSFVASPPADTLIRSGDEIVVFGPVDRVEDLECRRVGDAGDRAHDEGVLVNQARLAESRGHTGR